MTIIAIFLYAAGAMTAFHHIHEALGGKLTANSIFLGVVSWPLFWPVMYAVGIVGGYLSNRNRPTAAP